MMALDVLIWKLELQIECGMEQSGKFHEIHLHFLVPVLLVSWRIRNSEPLVDYYPFLLAINIKGRLLHASKQTPLS